MTVAQTILYLEEWTMQRFCALPLVLVGCALLGCSREPPKPAVNIQMTPGGINMQTPGGTVDMKAGPGGISVKGPGGENVNVQVPNVNVQVPNVPVPNIKVELPK
jgi:hypothetical protein